DNRTSVELLLIYGSHVNVPVLHPFPTRRSSDLASRSKLRARGRCGRRRGRVERPWPRQSKHQTSILLAARSRSGALIGAAKAARSEEHTSELQSQSKLVCRLLLEKKKK